MLTQDSAQSLYDKSSSNRLASPTFHLSSGDENCISADNLKTQLVSVCQQRAFNHIHLHFKLPLLSQLKRHILCNL